MAAYKNQHYVPRAYLQEFADQVPRQEPFLWVYQRGDKGPFRKSPKKTAISSYYYSWLDESGHYVHDVEHFLSQVEGRGLPPLLELSRGRPVEQMSPEDREWASMFLAFAGQRVPATRSHHEKQTGDLVKQLTVISASNKEYFHRMFRQAFAKAGKELPGDPEDVRQFVLSGKYDIKPSPQHSLRMMLELGRTSAEFVNSFEWRVLDAPVGTRFVTSDYPLVMVTTERLPQLWGVGWLSPFMEATFPLGPSSCLLISQHHPHGRETTTLERVREVNRRTIAHTYMQLYSSRKLTLGDFEISNSWWVTLSDVVDPRFLEE